MIASPEIVVGRDPDALASLTADRLLTRLLDRQASRGTASVVLTGGGIGTATLAALAVNPARGSLDWSRLDVWWGDERFVGAQDADRNDRQARHALLDAVGVDGARVHAMGDSTSFATAEDAAAAYAVELARAAAPEGYGETVPRFDVLLLGVGAEGHVASIFPESPAAYDTRPVVAVHGCPKPPPTRISLTLPALRAANEVWLLASTAGKSAAVAMVLGGAGEMQVPAAGARGRSRTLLLLDEAAAARVPAGLRRH